MPDIDLNASASDRKERGDRKERRERGDKDRRTAEKGYTRLMLNIGKAQGFFPGNLMELVNKSVNGRKPQIGRIDLLPDYTLFDVRSDDAHRIVEGLKNTEFFGQRLRAEYATDRNYAAEAKDREKKRAAKGKKGDSEAAASRKSKSGKSAAPKKAKKEKAHGNYEIFYKK